MYGHDPDVNVEVDVFSDNRALALNLAFYGQKETEDDVK